MVEIANGWYQNWVLGGVNIFVKYRVNKIENIFLEPIIDFKCSYVNIQTLRNKNFIIKILNETLNYNSILKRIKGILRISLS